MTLCSLILILSPPQFLYQMLSLKAREYLFVCLFVVLAVPKSSLDS